MTIAVKDLSFAYEGGDYIFRNLSFTLHTEWKTGLIGRNGRGKTTLLNLFLGSLPYTGVIIKAVEPLYFPFAVRDKRVKTIDLLKSIAVNADDYQIERELALLKAGFATDREFGTLSFGQQSKALLAALFLCEDRFLLIDEPTNHLDLEGREIVAKYLRKKDGFILVSHDRAFLDTAVDHIMAIDKEQITIQKGNFSSWFENKRLQDEFEINTNAKLAKEIKRLQSAAKRNSEWSDAIEKTKYHTKISGLKVDRGYIGHKSAKMMKRSKTLEDRQNSAIAEKSTLLKNIETAPKLKINQQEFHRNIYVSLRNVTIFRGGQPCAEGINFEVERGERVAIRGKNGSGKSTILQLICGEKLAYTGEMDIPSALKISSVAQDSAFLHGSLNGYADDRAIDKTLFLTILRKLDFKRSEFDLDIALLSEGQKKKVQIAAALSESANLYIWDEALNYIDLFSRLQIEDLIIEYQPTLLFVEHDRTFCEKVATRIVSI
ncbi:Lsa family ABC-F type ribosomal protection protein [Campylobacterota bacterium]|nr:Lsa family ABC-F type ribosomal protection protein [Campylobacterota bacterium]